MFCATEDHRLSSINSQDEIKIGLVLAKIALRNPKEPDISSIEVDAMDDASAVHLCLTEPVRIQLKLEEIDQKEVTKHSSMPRL